LPALSTRYSIERQCCSDRVCAPATMAGSMAPEKKAIVVHVNFDRRFGILVIDRTSGLVLFAGWVAQPTQPDVE
jgi:serine protease inhibitor